MEMELLANRNFRPGSLSSRRAWIEMMLYRRTIAAPLVALLAEGVDRNNSMSTQSETLNGRPPRGGRG